jgi:hypothetical protein
MFQILDFIGKGIKISREFTVGSSESIEKTEAGATATLKLT